MRSRFRNVCLALAVGAVALVGATPVLFFRGGRTPDLAVGAVALAGAVPAQAKGFGDVAKLELTVEPTTVKRGQTATVKLTVKLAPTFHTYPTQQLDPKADSYQTEFAFAITPEYVFVGQLQDPDGWKLDPKPDTPGTEVREYEDHVTWERKIVVLPQAKPGKTRVKWSVVAMSACDEHGCTIGKNLLPEAELTITEASQEVEPQYRDQLPKPGGVTPPAPLDGPKDVPGKPDVTGGKPKRGPDKPGEGAAPAVIAWAPASAEEHQSAIDWVLRQMEPEKATPTGSLAFILAGIFWGAVSLVTPCVFPMIPITVSFFLKQSDQKQNRPVTMALVYCGTIVVVLTIAAVLLLSLFRYLSTNPYMNIALGVLFVVFALSLFGMYDLELPSGLARFTSSREGRGGLVGTMFMALTFTIVSFACVAPFLGGFSGTAAAEQLTLLDRVLGGLAFAVTFALPFFVLALFPTLLKTMPRSGTWLNNVKVVMGFLELAAALVFFRTSEVVREANSTLFTYDLVLGLWIAIMLLCGLYLLNVFRLPHDSPVEHLGVVRMLFGLLFIGLGLYLLPAMFKTGPDGEKQRPAGVVYAWIDAFLLPESGGHRKEALPWGANLKTAIEEARTQYKDKRQHQLVLIDFTGQTCKNCRLNEQDVFTKPEVADLMRKYNLVELYTDRVPVEFYPPEIRDRVSADVKRLRTDADVNLKFQKDAFDTEQLPLYVILDPVPQGDATKIAVVKIYSEGKINDIAAFQRFLKEPLEAAGQRAQAR